MGQEHREVRRAAAKAFIESLEQLHQTLECANGQPTSHARNGGHSKAPVDSSAQFDLNSFEEAIADIEQFIQKQKKDEGKGIGTRD